MGLDLDLLEDDDEPTERFTRQACPRCGTDMAVALCLATTPCEVCGEGDGGRTGDANAARFPRRLQ